MDHQITKENLHSLCDLLSLRDNDLKNIIQVYGYPPFWNRKPDFTTLIHIILEQQVSLASAKAALDKLQARLGVITPGKLIALSPDEMKACYFSRQKIVYAQHLAESILSKNLRLQNLKSMPDMLVREELKKVKGIGDWTVDVFLMMALQRADCFPLGDIALVNSMKHVKGLPKETTRDELAKIADSWKPLRTVAAFLLWHAYLSKKKDAKRRLSININPGS